jgi:hypothetical protein
MRRPFPDSDLGAVKGALSIHLPGRVNRDPVASSHDIVAKRIVTLHGDFRFQIADGWNGSESLTRMRQRSLHMHCFIGDLLAANDRQPQRLWLSSAVDLVDDWCARFEFPRDAGGMPFHDETSARRLGYWLALYLALRLTGEHALAGSMWSRIDELFSILSADSFYAGCNNHGMFQDLSILYFCMCSPDAPDAQKRSLERLEEYFAQSVCSDGVHKEHSPAYHYLIAANIDRHLPLLRELDPRAATKLGALVKKMARFGVNIIPPDGKYPPIGDTQPAPIPENYHEVFCNATVERSAFFFDGGYAVLRDDPAKREAQTYAVLCASHHSDYHKHNDDLSVLLYANGWIIGESGPYGYDYAHPLSKHGYSTAAHSTLTVEGVTPCEEPGFVTLDEAHETRHSATAKGSNRRHVGVEHDRSVTLDRRTSTLEIVDEVRSTESRRMSLLWQLAPDITAEPHESAAHLFRNGIHIATIVIQSDRAIDLMLGYGAHDPAGYFFPKLGASEDGGVLRVRVADAVAWNCKTTIYVVDA